MARYSVADARKNLAEVLDHAEAGDEVLIERRGVAFRVGVVKARRRRHRATIEICDTAVADGNWTWTWSARGARFKGRPKR